MLEFRLPAFRSLVGLCLAGMLSGCVMETAEGEEGVSGQVSEALDANWLDIGKPSNLDVLDLSVAGLNATENEIWVIASDGQVYSKTTSGDWTPGATKPSGVTLAGVAACRRGTKTDVIATDSAGKIWAKTRGSSGAWGSWATVGAAPGTAIGKPGVNCVTGNDRLDVWVRGLNNSLWHSYRFGTGAWSAWGDEGAPTGGLQGPPAAYTRRGSPLTIDIVARGTGDAYNGYTVWHRAYMNQWYAWEDSGGMKTASNPWMGIWMFGQAKIMAQGAGNADTAIYDNVFSNTAWYIDFGFAAPYAGWLGNPVFVATYGTGNFETYVRGSSKNVWRHR